MRMYMRYYQFVVGVVRLGIVGFLIYYAYLGGLESTADIIYYVLLGLYGFVFSVFRLQKWVSLAEIVTVMMFTWLQSNVFLYLLWIIPTIVFATRNDRKMYILFYMGLMGAYGYLKTGMIIEASIFALVIGLILYFFYSQFQSMERVENDLYHAKNEKDGLKRTIAQKENEINQVSVMLIKSKELIDGKDVNEIIKMMMGSCLEFFNSYYVVFYVRSKGRYVKVNDFGDKTGLDIDESVPEDSVTGHRILQDMLEIDMRYQDNKWALIRIYGKRIPLGERKQLVFVPFEEMDLEIALLYLHQAMVRIQDVELMQESMVRANYDKLTSLPNRDYIERHFKYLSTLISRENHFSMVLFDIDKFKSFNDDFGHEVGDQVLKLVAQTVKNAVRESDFVGRLGGEEFVILLLNPNGREFEITDKIRNLVELTPNSKRMVTISMGISRFGEHGNTWKELYNTADKALYYSKKNGRNQVTIYDDSMKDIMKR
ncbi:GGDEF domain protein [Bacillus cereus]|uniref:GGDEF domain protein n=2 Tax=Bacillus cereus TaxID=1396 RepID=A0A164QQV1_BACCE|nr:GGDEF domain protein [Bacillus cereus]